LSFAADTNQYNPARIQIEQGFCIYSACMSNIFSIQEVALSWKLDLL
jgi:hypothetical protein